MSSRFRKRFAFSPERIKCFILVRDLYSPIIPLVSALRAQGVRPENVVLIDLGCKSHACLETLNKLSNHGCTILRASLADQKYGPYFVWMSERRDYFRKLDYPFIVTDPDLKIPDSIPGDWLYQLMCALNLAPSVSKAALPLSLDGLDIQEKLSVIEHEQGLINHPIYRALNGFLSPHRNFQFCATDTTLALYRPRCVYTTFAVRLEAIYSIKHLPWYNKFRKSAEFRYYSENKDPNFGQWS